MAEGTKTKAKSGTTTRGMLAAAKPVAIATSRGPELGQALNGIPPGEWLPDANGLPPDCPVLPVGIAGGTLYLLDRLGQLRTLSEPYGKGHILGLFLGDDNYLSWAWERKNKFDKIDGFDAMKVASWLVRVCSAKPIWDGVERVRGRGVWLSARGELIVHTGDDLLLGARSLSVPELDGYIYPARPPIPRPWHEPVEPAALRLVMPLLRTWHWARPDVDPVLLAGWIAAAKLAAALKWRPSAFIIGDKGTGKSTLQELIKYWLGGVIHTADTTAAGIYQHIGHDCLPVTVDELEPEADNARNKAILKLARLASSGTVMLRGGDRHQGVEFAARNSFLFSAVNSPPLQPTELSRMALLLLKPLLPGTAPPVIDAQTCTLMGSMMTRRLIDEWPRFGETLAAFRGELAAAGMEPRGQDTFGTLLACQDMLFHEGWDEERLKHPVDGDGELVPWRELLNPREMVEFEDSSDNWRGCLDHLLSVQVDAWRHGTKRTVGQVISEYYDNVDDMSLTKARGLLTQAGLTIALHDVDAEHLQRPWLAVPNQDPLTRTLFQGSKWAGDVGAAVWAGALRQAPAEMCQTGRTRINGVLRRVTLISLDRLYGSEGIMTQS